jgi:short subunit fatty acids transporter
MAKFFIRISTPGTYPVLIAVYSAVLGWFVPSAGSKWRLQHAKWHREQIRIVCRDLKHRQMQIRYTLLRVSVRVKSVPFRQ